MSGWMEQWLLGVACASMVMVVSGALVKGGGGQRVCKLVGSLLLLLVTLGPMVGMAEEDWQELLQWDTQAMEEAEEALMEQNQLLYESIIEEETGAYILDKAESLGVTCQVEVVVAWDDEIPQPWSACLTGTWTQAQRDALAEMMQADLGIPYERQSFEVISG